MSTLEQMKVDMARAEAEFDEVRPGDSLGRLAFHVLTVELVRVESDGTVVVNEAATREQWEDFRALAPAACHVARAVIVQAGKRCPLDAPPPPKPLTAAEEAARRDEAWHDRHPS